MQLKNSMFDLNARMLKPMNSSRPTKEANRMKRLALFLIAFMLVNLSIASTETATGVLADLPDSFANEQGTLIYEDEALQLFLTEDIYIDYDDLWCEKRLYLPILVVNKTQYTIKIFDYMIYEASINDWSTIANVDPGLYAPQRGQDTSLVFISLQKELETIAIEDVISIEINLSYDLRDDESITTIQENVPLKIIIKKDSPDDQTAFELKPEHMLFENDDLQIMLGDDIYIGGKY